MNVEFQSLESGNRGNSKRTFPQAITYHVFSSYIYQPITAVNYCSPWQTNLNPIASASDGRNIVL